MSGLAYATGAGCNIRLPVELRETGPLRPRFSLYARRTSLKLLRKFSMICGGAFESWAEVSCAAKENSQAPVARISNPSVRKGVGIKRCEMDSTKETVPPG